MNSYFWSEEQKQTLEKAYRNGGLSVAESMLPEKKRSTIAAQASRLELTKPKPRKPKTDGVST